MILRRRLDRLEARHGDSGLPDRLVLFTVFVPMPPEGEAPGPGEAGHALVIPKLGGSAVTLWRDDGETEAAFRACAEAALGRRPARTLMHPPGNPCP